MNRSPITARGEKKLRADLQRLKTRERPRIVAAIAETRASKDVQLPASPRASLARNRRTAVVRLALTNRNSAPSSSSKRRSGSSRSPISR